MQNKFSVSHAGSDRAELQIQGRSADPSLPLSKHPVVTHPNSAYPRCVALITNCLFFFFKNNAYVANYTLLTKAVITACNYHGPYLEKM